MVIWFLRKILPFCFVLLRKEDKNKQTNKQTKNPVVLVSKENMKSIHTGWSLVASVALEYLSMLSMLKVLWTEYYKMKDSAYMDLITINVRMCPLSTHFKLQSFQRIISWLTLEEMLKTVQFQPACSEQGCQPLTRSGCPGPHPIWSWIPLSMGCPQLLWTTWPGASSPSE